MVNEKFADAIAPYAKDGDSIWVHDYHLLLLPRLLRDRLSHLRNIRIGFFLHTPFPSKDAFAILPLREEICDGLLSCDLVGFHIREYVELFLNSAAEVLRYDMPSTSSHSPFYVLLLTKYSGVTRSPSDLHYGGRKLIADEFPIGIDVEDLKTSLASEETISRMKELRQDFRGRKVIVGVDRLDYIKGVPQKMKAFDKMLEDFPEWTEKVVMVQLCVPTRSSVPEYQILRSEVEELGGRINGSHGKLHRQLNWILVSFNKLTSANKVL